MKDGQAFSEEISRALCIDVAGSAASPHSPPLADQLRRNGFYRRFGKRAFDILLVIVASPVVLLVVAVLALLVMLDRGGPFYGHERVGWNGRTFRCWKLRTMLPNSEEFLAAYLEANPDARREWESEFKLSNDPRITRIGCFLRKTSLDELPQLWNVLVGEMSLVGPRPVTRAELPLYGASLPSYLAQRPGVTGKWQVSGRNAISYSQRVEMDASLLVESSLTNDLKLILATVLVVLRRTGR